MKQETLEGPAFLLLPASLPTLLDRSGAIRSHCDSTASTAAVAWLALPQDPRQVPRGGGGDCCISCQSSIYTHVELYNLCGKVYVESLAVQFSCTHVPAGIRAVVPETSTTQTSQLANASSRKQTYGKLPVHKSPSVGGNF